MRKSLSPVAAEIRRAECVGGRLKALEEENRQLKRLVADQDFNLQVVKDCWEKDGDRPRAAGGGRVCDADRRVE